MSADASLWFDGSWLDAGGCFVRVAEPIAYRADARKA